LPEYLVEELSIDGRFEVLAEMRLAFQVCPVQDNLVGVVLRLASELGARIAQETRDEERALAADSPLDVADLFVEETRAVIVSSFPSRHAGSTLFVDGRMIPLVVRDVTCGRSNRTANVLQYPVWLHVF
jgi:hypothetical protein